MVKGARKSDFVPFNAETRRRRVTERIKKTGMKFSRWYLTIPCFSASLHLCDSALNRERFAPLDGSTFFSIMPELPEVETMRRGIAAIAGNRIVGAERLGDAGG